jgi:hypothetical protein
MSIREEGSKIIVDGSITGSLFPSSERQTAFPLLIDGSRLDEPLLIEGSVYGCAIEMRGGVDVRGPVVSRGDTVLSPAGARIRLCGGITVNGTLDALRRTRSDPAHLCDAIERASVVVRGDVIASQNVALSDTVVFGSIRAVNCRLLRCVVLGTVIVQESLTVSMSAIGGYATHEVSFEGSCTLIHALGESHMRPVFAPFDAEDGSVVPSDIRYYPAVRSSGRLFNLVHAGAVYPEYSRLEPRSDWIAVDTSSPEGASGDVPVDASGDVSGHTLRWVLSIGGRIGDFSSIQDSIDALVGMLRCGFEYDHLAHTARPRIKARTLERLTPEEAWVLDEVCV